MNKELEARKKFNDEIRSINMLKCLVQKEGRPVSKTQLEILSDHIEHSENSEPQLNEEHYDDTQAEFMRLKQEIGFSLLGEMQKQILKDHQE